MVCTQGHGRPNYLKRMPIIHRALAQTLPVFWSYGILGNNARSGPAREVADWLEPRAIQNAGRPIDFFVHVSRQQYVEDRRRLDPGWQNA